MLKIFTLAVLITTLQLHAQEPTLQQPPKVESRGYYYFNFGPALLPGYSDAIQYTATFGKFWEVTPQASVKALFQNSINARNKDYFGALTLGANYYFTQEDISPYAGGEFGFGTALGIEPHAFYGFGSGASAGVQFFRTSDLQLNVELRAFAIFDSVDEAPPVNTSLTLGILF